MCTLDRWKGLKKKMLNRREQLAALQQAEAVEIRRKSDAFAERVDDFRKSVTRFMPWWHQQPLSQTIRRSMLPGKSSTVCCQVNTGVKAAQAKQYHNQRTGVTPSATCQSSSTVNATNLHLTQSALSALLALRCHRPWLAVCRFFLKRAPFNVSGGELKLEAVRPAYEVGLHAAGDAASFSAAVRRSLLEHFAAVPRIRESHT